MGKLTDAAMKEFKSRGLVGNYNDESTLRAWEKAFELLATIDNQVPCNQGMINLTLEIVIVREVVEKAMLCNEESPDDERH